MNYEIKTESAENDCSGKPWRLAKAEACARLRIVIEVEKDFLEGVRRGEFDRVGQAVAAELHALFRQYRHEAKHG
jgi:hypothetical protein